jgi:hypothetical protein
VQLARVLLARLLSLPLRVLPSSMRSRSVRVLVKSSSLFGRCARRKIDCGGFLLLSTLSAGCVGLLAADICGRRLDWRVQQLCDLAVHDNNIHTPERKVATLASAPRAYPSFEGTLFGNSVPIFVHAAPRGTSMRPMSEQRAPQTSHASGHASHRQPPRHLRHPPCLHVTCTSHSPAPACRSSRCGTRRRWWPPP